MCCVTQSPVPSLGMSRYLRGRAKILRSARQDVMVPKGTQIAEMQIALACPAAGVGGGEHGSWVWLIGDRVRPRQDHDGWMSPVVPTKPGWVPNLPALKPCPSHHQATQITPQDPIWRSLQSEPYKIQSQRRGTFSQTIVKLCPIGGLRVKGRKVVSW